MKNIILAIVLAALLGPLSILLLLSSTPAVEIDTTLTAVGAVTPVKARIAAPHGVRRVAAYIEQGGVRYPVYESSAPARRLLFWTSRQPAREYAFAVGTKNAPAVKDGPARFIVEATSNDLRGSTGSAARDVNIATRPPAIAADGAQHYINQGGCELVTFTVSGFWTEAGVRAGKYRFRSFAAPGGAASRNARFSLFAFPWDLPADTVPVVYASNPAGAEAAAGFWHRVFPKSFRKRDLDLSDAFLQKVDNEIDPGGSGDLLARFLKINGEMRRRNNQTIADLRFKTEERFLWTGPFLRLAAKDESKFADDRTYIYKGKKVDEQVHLGYDLSNVMHTPILAANDGKVVFAERLGIYGNCIVVDHGYGLQSIYGHLSQIQAQPGASVKKGQSMGLSGDTGLAGGDHLHFSMQADGVQVDPKEWWDAHWIADRVLSKIQSR